MQGKIFSFLPFEEEYSTFQTKLTDMEVWHKRLGHCHQQRMISMKKHDSVRGVPKFTDFPSNCSACQYGKPSRKPFQKSTWRSTQKLQLIHIDVAGPLSTPSIKGSRYYILFIDDFSRMCWVFFMKYKSEVAGIFFKFKKNVENISNYRIQAIRSDNGKGYTSSEFNLYCEEAGIDHQLIAPYTLEQNNVSERRNRYIMEMVRCMLNDKFSKENGTAKVDEEKFRSLIGCLLYLTATRPDILHATSLLSRFMHCPSEIHMRAAKKILRYIKGTCSYGVKFQKCQELKLHGFSNSDWGGSIDDMKSTSGFCFNLGSAIFSWSSKKQDTVAQSTTEAEFIATTAAVNQALWLQKLLRDLHMEGEEATEISVDNQAAIAISYNPVFHGKTKHFNIKLYFLREVQKNGDVRLIYCKSEEQLADLFTKPLAVNRFEFLRQDWSLQLLKQGGVLKDCFMSWQRTSQRRSNQRFIYALYFLFSCK